MEHIYLLIVVAIVVVAYFAHAHINKSEKYCNTRENPAAIEELRGMQMVSDPDGFDFPRRRPVAFKDAQFELYKKTFLTNKDTY